MQLVNFIFSENLNSNYLVMVNDLNGHTPEDIENRALVILDDYTGTGDQFLSEFYARNDENRALLNKYKKYILHH